jgi:hypothetical protein
VSVLLASIAATKKSHYVLVPLSLHTYVWPFVIIWPIFLRYYLSDGLYNKHIGGSEWTFVWCGTIITAQSLVWLSTNWNVNLKSLFTSLSAKTVQDAKLIKVIPVANAGSAEICKIVRDDVSPSWFNGGAHADNDRLAEKITSPSSSRSAGFSTMPQITPFLL